MLAARFLSKAQGCPLPGGKDIFMALHPQIREKALSIWLLSTGASGSRSLFCVVETSCSQESGQIPAPGLGRFQDADTGLAEGTLVTGEEDCLAQTGQQGSNIAVPGGEGQGGSPARWGAAQVTGEAVDPPGSLIHGVITTCGMGDAQLLHQPRQQVGRGRDTKLGIRTPASSVLRRWMAQPTGYHPL